MADWARRVDEPIEAAELNHLRLHIQQEPRRVMWHGPPRR